MTGFKKWQQNMVQMHFQGAFFCFFSRHLFLQCQSQVKLWKLTLLFRPLGSFFQCFSPELVFAVSLYVSGQVRILNYVGIHLGLAKHSQYIYLNNKIPIIELLILLEGYLAQVSFSTTTIKGGCVSLFLTASLLSGSSRYFFINESFWKYLAISSSNRTKQSSCGFGEFFRLLSLLLLLGK